MSRAYLFFANFFPKNLVNVGDVPFIGVTHSLASHGTWRPNSTALVCGEKKCTYRELNAGINRVANGLIEMGTG